MKKIIMLISVLIVSLFVTNVNANYDLDYNQVCKTALEKQSLSGANKMPTKYKVQIDGISNNLGKNYTDEKLMVVNNKIINILAKRNRNNVISNIYIYLLIALERQVSDNIILQDDYIKNSCALLLNPIEPTNTNFIDQQLGNIKFQKENQEILNNIDKKDENQEMVNQDNNNDTIKSNESSVVFNIPEFANKGTNVLYDDSVNVDYIKKTIEDKGYMEGLPQYYLTRLGELMEAERQGLKYYKENPFSKKFYEAGIHLVGQELLGEIMDSPQIDNGLSKSEDKRLDEITAKMLELKNEWGEIKFSEHKNRRNDMDAYVKGKNREREINAETEMLEYEKLLLMKKDLELKNVCVRRTNEGMGIYDIDTLEILGMTNDEYMDILNKQRELAYYGYSFNCYYFIKYPELKQTVNDLEKKSISELNKLLNNHGFNPSYNNTKDDFVFSYRDRYNIETPLEQAMFIHENALNMKKIEFLIEIRKKQGVTDLKELFKGINIRRDDFLVSL